MTKAKVLAWLGPPASGKGTYSKLIGTMIPQGVVNVVASDIIREQISQQTKAGLEMKWFFDRSEHVPGNLLASALKRKLLSLTDGPPDYVQRIIFLDGFPRSVSQAELFLPFSSTFDISCIHLHLRRSWASIKSNGRLVCSKCGTSYNDATIDEGGVCWPKDMPTTSQCPVTPECDRGQLERRADMVNFNKRYDDYEKTELRALELLSSKAPSRTIEITGGYQSMVQPIGMAVFELLGLDRTNLWSSLKELDARTQKGDRPYHPSPQGRSLHSTQRI